MEKNHFVPLRASSVGNRSTPSKEDPMAELSSFANCVWRENSSEVLEKSVMKFSNKISVITLSERL